MKKILFIFVTIFLSIAVGYFLWNRGAMTTTSTFKVFTTQTQPTSAKEVPIKRETVVENLTVPWSIVFTASNRLLVTERPGRIRIVENDTLQNKPLITFPEVVSVGEEGLMGLITDPEYTTNKRLFVCLAYQKDNGYLNKVVSLNDKGTSATIEKIIIDNIPSAQNHAGCRIKFGPDKKLYITTGDATDKQIAQNLRSLGGKILRVNADGSIPQDNPFPNSPIWSYGHRNSQGLDWHPQTQMLVETEHGPSGFDGPGGGDEINVIQKGGNYGWPLVSHEQTDPRFISPKLVFTPAVAPAAGLFYTSDVIPQFTNNYFFAALRGSGMYRVVFSDSNPEEVALYEKLKEVDVGRVREIAEGPEGAIYFTTSNRDGRGTERLGDDKIYRIIPTE